MVAHAFRSSAYSGGARGFESYYPYLLVVWKRWYESKSVRRDFAPAFVAVVLVRYPASTIKSASWKVCSLDGVQTF